MKIRMGLQSKLIISTTLLILLMSSVFSYFLVTRQKALLFDALEARGTTIANGIASNCRFSILAEDKTSLKGFVDGAMAESDVVNVAIIAKDGKILGHTLESKVSASADSDIEKNGLRGTKVQWPSSKLVVISLPVINKVAARSGSEGSDLESMMWFGDNAAAPAKPAETAPATQESIGSVQILSTVRINSQLQRSSEIYFCLLAIAFM